MITHCPVCGRPAPGTQAPDETACMPSNCPSWTTEAIYDHEQREWLTVDADGYVLDGRHETEVR